jgi:hypothetical protein
MGGSTGRKQIATNEFLAVTNNASIEYKRVMLDAVAKAKSTGFFDPRIFDKFIKIVELISEMTAERQDEEQVVPGS